MAPDENPPLTPLRSETLGGGRFALVLLLLVFLVLDSVAVFGPDSIRDIGPLVAGLGTFWQPVVIAAWFVRGRTSWFLRWPTSLVALVLLSAIKLLTTQGKNDEFELESELLLLALLLAQFAIPLLAIAFAWWRRRKAAMSPARPWQFSLRQLLIWVSGVAMAAALARFLNTLPRHPDSRLTTAELAVSCGFVFFNAIVVSYLVAWSHAPVRRASSSLEVVVQLLATGGMLSAAVLLLAWTIPTLFCAGSFCFFLQAIAAFVAISLAEDVGWKLVPDEQAIEPPTSA